MKRENYVYDYIYDGQLWKKKNIRKIIYNETNFLNIPISIENEIIVLKKIKEILNGHEHTANYVEFTPDEIPL